MEVSAEKEMILVPKAEYEELKQLKENLPRMLEAAKEEGGMDRLKKLHQKEKEDPEKYREIAKNRYAANKEKIKARRREAYRAKKEAEGKTVRPGVSSQRMDETAASSSKR